MFREHRTHQQERKIVSVQPLVAVGGRVVCSSEAKLPNCTRHGHRQLPEVVLTQFFSPADKYDVLETCGELKIKINT